MHGFDEAIRALRVGRSVTRQSWGKHLWLVVNGAQCDLGNYPLRDGRNDRLIKVCAQNQPYAAIWQATQQDLLAEDWIIR